MKEFEIYNVNTQKTSIIFGYNEKDAFRRYPELNNSEWVVTYVEYID